MQPQWAPDPLSYHLLGTHSVDYRMLFEDFEILNDGFGRYNGVSDRIPPLFGLAFGFGLFDSGLSDLGQLGLIGSTFILAYWFVGTLDSLDTGLVNLDFDL